MYKRQRVLSTGQQGEQGEHVGLAGFVDGLSVQGNGERVGRTIAQAVFPVSYTHLDVYKRQLLLLFALHGTHIP